MILEIMVTYGYKSLGYLCDFLVICRLSLLNKKHFCSISNEFHICNTILNPRLEYDLMGYAANSRLDYDLMSYDANSRLDYDLMCYAAS